MKQKILYSVLMSMLFITFSLGTNMNISSAADTFDDVEKGYWAEEEIYYLVEKGIVDGRESGEFGPEEDVSRAQAAKMMSNALELDNISLSSSPSFTDVDTSFWAYKHIERSAERGVFTGKEDGRFDPNGSIKRAQLAAILGRAFFGEEAQHNGTSADFEDISPDFWAEEYIAVLQEHNILLEAENFRPNDNATRAEVSAYLARALQLTSESEDTVPERKPADRDILFKAEVDTEADTLNVRSGPGMNYDIITSYEDGTPVDVYEDGEWFLIDHNGKWAYVYHSYIKKSGGSQSTETEQSGEQKSTESPSEDILAIAKVTVNDLNVRTGPGDKNKIIGSLDRGDIVNVQEHVTEDWALIDYNGNEGYVHRYYLLEKKPGSTALEDKTIVVDAGHGGHDNGASGHGLNEKEVVLDVAVGVADKLEDAGVNVIMTRDDDTFLSLERRVEIAEKADADSFVSIHANAATSAAKGAETYYNDRYLEAESRALAQSIQQELLSQTGMSDRGVKEAGFYVIKYTDVPSTLVELGFVTNPQDAARMKKDGYGEQAADAVFDGIVNYYDW